MNPDELIHVLTSMHVAHELAEAIRTPELQTAHGWDLKRWRCDETPEVVRFVHHDRRGQPDLAVLCVEDARPDWVYEATRHLMPCATTLLKLRS
jgi:hypothetical protein